MAVVATRKRTHLSRKPIGSVRAAKQVSSPDHKPVGFWYGVDGDWERWCRDEGMEEWIDGVIEYELVMGRENMLILDGVGEIIAFHEEYSVGPNYRCYPDWQRVAREYDGIEIAPYCWQLRQLS